LAVKIRLLRMGRKKKPFYRIVVIDSRARRDGRYLEKIGDYNPVSNPAEVNIDKEKVLKWLEKGAEPSKTVFNLLQKEGIALDWHLIRNKASEQVRNVELQKFELAKKVREDKKAVAESVVKEEKFETPEPEAEVSEVVAEKPVEEAAPEEAPKEGAKHEEKPEPETPAEPAAEDKAVEETPEVKKTETAPEPEEKPVEKAAPEETPKEDAKPEEKPEPEKPTEPDAEDKVVVAEEAVEETKEKEKTDAVPETEEKPKEEKKEDE